MREWPRPGDAVLIFVTNAATGASVRCKKKRQLQLQHPRRSGPPWRIVDRLEPQVSFQHPRSGAWFPEQASFAAGTEGRDINVATTPIAEATSCSLENYLVLPDHSMDERIREAKGALGKQCVILGHHYQRDEVVRFADYRGDS